MKSIRIVSILILIICFLNGYTWVVRYVLYGGNKLGVLTNPFIEFIEFPYTVKKIIRKLSTGLSGDDVRVDNTFHKINLLDRNIFLLSSHYENEKDAWVYNLKNLRNDSTMHSWLFTRNHFSGSYNDFPYIAEQSPMLLENGSIITLIGRGHLYSLVCLDKESNVVWHNRSMSFHHSINMSHDNDIWVPARQLSRTKIQYPNMGTSYKWIDFIDDILVKVDVETGEIVFQKPLSEIFIDNGYFNMVYGYDNGGVRGMDFFHLNDIEPILFNGPFWQKGDLLLSLRSRSTIVLYRPRSNKILRFIFGPFLYQHDVDVISENEISIFNNNRLDTRNNYITSKEDLELNDTKFVFNKSSNVVVYNFSDSTFTTPFMDVFEKEKIFTLRQGLHTFLENGDLFVESTEQRTIYIISKNKIVLKKYAIEANEKGIVPTPRWTRLYENFNMKIFTK